MLTNTLSSQSTLARVEEEELSRSFVYSTISSKHGGEWIPGEEYILLRDVYFGQQHTFHYEY